MRRVKLGALLLFALGAVAWGESGRPTRERLTVNDVPSATATTAGGGQGVPLLRLEDPTTGNPLRPEPATNTGGSTGGEVEGPARDRRSHGDSSPLIESCPEHAPA